MPVTRELLAVVLGVLLGLGLIAAPRTALRLSVFRDVNRRRRGEYGADDDGATSEKMTWLVRGLGVACLAVAAFVAYQTYV